MIVFACDSLVVHFGFVGLFYILVKKKLLNISSGNSLNLKENIITGLLAEGLGQCLTQ